jgi:hypothetical protein
LIIRARHRCVLRLAECQLGRGRVNNPLSRKEDGTGRFLVYGA